LAEVCRNRTDRPDKIGTVGFEVPGGHQPACTSTAIIQIGLKRVKRKSCASIGEKKEPLNGAAQAKEEEFVKEW